MFYLLRRAFQKALLPLFFCLAILPLVGLTAKPSFAYTVADTVAFSSPPQGSIIEGYLIDDPREYIWGWDFTPLGTHVISVKAGTGDVLEVNWHCSGGSGNTATYTIDHSETVTMSADEMTVNIDTEARATFINGGIIHVQGAYPPPTDSWAVTTLTVRNLTTGEYRTSSSYSRQWFFLRMPDDPLSYYDPSYLPPAEQQEYRNGVLVLSTP